ncbi:MAG: alpha-2-macroglobulin family protein [Bacteroidota bacterium]
MKYTFRILLLMTCLNLSAPKIFAQRYTISDFYKVDSLALVAQPKPALTLIEQLNRQARADGNSPMLIKSVIYRMLFQSYLEENAFNKILVDLKQDINLAKQPEKSILQSLLAETYWKYYLQNRYQIANRTFVIGDIGNDISTWSIRKITTEAVNSFNASLKETKLLQNTRIDFLDSVLTADRYNRKLRPTLFDLLAHRAIDAFTNPQINISNIESEGPDLNDPVWLASSTTFLAAKIPLNDSVSFNGMALTLFKNLLKFHNKPEDFEAQVDIDLKRLKFCYLQNNSRERSELYNESLEVLARQAAHTEIYADIVYEQALLHKNTQLIIDTNKLNLITAMALATKAIKAYPKSPGAQNSTNLINQITFKQIELGTKEVIRPNQPAQLHFTYQNIDTVYLKIYKRPVGRDVYFNKFIDFENFVKNKTILKEWRVSLPAIKDYQQHTLIDKMDGLPLGSYVLVTQNSKELNSSTIYNYTNFSVSQLAVTDRTLNRTRHQYIVTNNTTGKPLGKVKIEQKGSNNLFQDILYTSKPGIALTIKTANISGALITYQQDSLWVNVFNYNNNYKPEPKRVILFTDRPIYRPGQTVYYKGIFITNEQNENKLLVNQNLSVIFKDINHKDIETTKVVTNDYGTFQGSFTIPVGSLNGRMMLNTAYGNITVQVEEYKRPTFEILFNKANEKYKLNDSIKVSGMATAFAGYAVSGALVKYTIYRRFTSNYKVYAYLPQTPQQIALGKTLTNAGGKFELSFFAKETNTPEHSIFEIKVEITDANGETKVNSKTIMVGKKDLELTIPLPEQLFLTTKNDSIPFRILNLNNEPIKGKLLATWCLLQPPKRLTNKSLFNAERYTLSKSDFIKYFPHDEYANENNPEKWAIKNNVFEQEIMANEGSGNLYFNSNDLPPGYYKVKFLAINTVNDTISLTKTVRIYGSQPLRIKQSSEWLVAEKNKILPTEEAIFRVASLLPGSKMYYEVYHKDSVTKKIWLNVSSKQTIVKIKPDLNFGNSFAVQFTMVQNGMSYNSLQKISVVDTAKQLEIKFLTFRDKLQPGEKETWKLSIRNKAGEKQMAELLATLYDASLDEFSKMNWDNSLQTAYNYETYNWRLNLNNWNSSYMPWSTRSFQPYYPFATRKYEGLNLFGFNYYGGYNNGYRTYLKILENAAKGQKLELTLNSEDALLNEVVVRGLGTPASSESKIVVRGKNSLAASIIEDHTVYTFSMLEDYNKKLAITMPAANPRINFKETAFFYPQLRTNENGEISIEFTIPQSLTRYKMMGFAHTKDLKTAVVTNELITQKQLAISANAPRFFREGDTIYFSAKLNNLSGSKLNGEVYLELKDALTGKNIQLLERGKTLNQHFEIADAGSLVFKWPLIIPGRLNAITYKVLAQAGMYSDGEEMTIPVLPNSMLVTESMPLNVRGNTSKTFNMEKLLKSGSSKTLCNQALTFEFTANPVWYAIRALPYLMESPNEGSEQTFSRLYANSFATGIINSSPKIKTIFNQWQQTNNGISLLANLEKNQELKSILLEETPWIREAGNETERKKRLAVLFDLNRMSYELKDNFEKLEKMQNANGSFPWFTGMSEDRYITQHIVLGMGQLKRMKLVDEKIYPAFEKILTKALTYLDQKLIEDYQLELSGKSFSYLPLHYLFARSYSNPKAVNPEFKKAVDFYHKKIAGNWKTMGSYQQGQAALVLYRSGNNAEALKIINLLKQTAQHHEEMGMYWANNRAGLFWYQNQIETQAILIEAFNEVAADGLSVEEMKIWLLKNKQTNDWKTTKATVAACYALLMQGYDLLSESSEPKILIGHKNLSSSTSEAGTGYQKISIPGIDVKPEMGKIEIKNNNKTIAWGALYWQYFENLNKITSAATGIKIKKQLFLAQPSAKGNVLIPLTATNTLSPGDLLKVRIEIYADREMEYVHLKDMRSAGFEPVNVISKYKYQDGLSYYESTKDASTNFFISRLRKGTYVFEYLLRVTHAGNFANGITSLQCLYAPEFSAHTEGINVKVKDN